MPNELKKHYTSFDILKIVSITKVFFHHIMMDLYIVHPMYNLSLFTSIVITANHNFGMTACSMFILISGATLALTDKGDKPLTFYKKRFIRLIIPFYIAYIFCFLVRFYNHRAINFYPEGIAPWRFIFTLLGIDEYLSANGVMTFSLGVGEWFLGCIMFCYLLYPLVYRCHKKWKLPTFIVMTIYYIAINQYLYTAYPFKIANHMNCLSQFYNFYLGFILIDKDVIKLINKKWLIIVLPLTLFMLFAPIPLPLCDNYKTTIEIVLLFICYYVFENEFSSNDIIVKIASFFTAISLEIYLVHHFIIYEVDYLLHYRPLRGYQALLVILFDIIATIILAKITNILSQYILKALKKTTK